MPARRGGGASNADAGLPEPPVKRLIPWSRNGSNTTDVIAGRLDKAGAFQGMVLSEVTLGALQRFFTLGVTQLPKELKGLPDDGKEAYPIYVVTRGSYGRNRDSMPGPQRNQGQAHVWNQVRKIRAEMPMMRIICVDIPTYASMSQISSCLDPELAGYDELAFYEGSWYTPDVLKMDKLASQLRDIEKRPANTHVNPLTGEEGVKFRRQQFNWRAMPGDSDVFVHTWKKVMDEPDFEAPKAPKIEVQARDPPVAE
mmetsp:Transcript_17344/g.40430  ORF Transcript_17344/g.40430 Transcript_17344/m.40430 type:complete len:255 (-) Transcript_17344:91-855(-)